MGDPTGNRPGTDRGDGPNVEWCFAVGAMRESKAELTDRLRRVAASIVAVQEYFCVTRWSPREYARAYAIDAVSLVNDPDSRDGWS